jgi:hypothetical protein
LEEADAHKDFLDRTPAEGSNKINRIEGRGILTGGHEADEGHEDGRGIFLDGINMIKMIGRQGN